MRFSFLAILAFTGIITGASALPTLVKRENSTGIDPIILQFALTVSFTSFG